jgi:hypothetical protein
VLGEVAVDTAIDAQLAADHAAIEAGDVKVCGATDDAHPGLVCVRAAHPHEPGNVVPHVALVEQDDGSLAPVMFDNPDVHHVEPVRPEPDRRVRRHRAALDAARQQHQQLLAAMRARVSSRA